MKAELQDSSRLYDLSTYTIYKKPGSLPKSRNIKIILEVNMGSPQKLTKKEVAKKTHRGNLVLRCQW
jgi:hypothetical protein